MTIRVRITIHDESGQLLSQFTLRPVGWEPSPQRFADRIEDQLASLNEEEPPAEPPAGG